MAEINVREELTKKCQTLSKFLSKHIKELEELEEYELCQEYCYYQEEFSDFCLGYIEFRDIEGTYVYIVSTFGYPINMEWDGYVVNFKIVGVTTVFTLQLSKKDFEKLWPMYIKIQEDKNKK